MITPLGWTFVDGNPWSSGASRRPARARPLETRSQALFAPHPGINFSRLPVPGDAAGLVFVIGSVVVILLGLPALRPFFLAALAIGLVLAAALVALQEIRRG